MEMGHLQANLKQYENPEVVVVASPERHLGWFTLGVGIITNTYNTPEPTAIPRLPLKLKYKAKGSDSAPNPKLQQDRPAA